MAAFAYGFLVQALRAAPGQTDTLADALGNDRKGWISPLFYAIAIPIAFVAPLLSFALYWTVAAMWIVPDPRIERADRRLTAAQASRRSLSCVRSSRSDRMSSLNARTRSGSKSRPAFAWSSSSAASSETGC